jgi:hypothetical protein
MNGSLGRATESESLAAADCGVSASLSGSAPTAEREGQTCGSIKSCRARPCHASRFATHAKNSMSTCHAIASTHSKLVMVILLLLDKRTQECYYSSIQEEPFHFFGPL